MKDALDIIKNIDTIYNSNSSLSILKDFERVLDELDLYVYDNWIDGEIVEGPTVKRHWVSVSFMWPHKSMPDPMGGKRLLDYGCIVKYEKTSVVEPKKVTKPEDLRPGTQKGKLETKPVWVVHINMPKKLLTDIYDGYMNHMKQELNINANNNVPEQPAEQIQPPAEPMPQQPGVMNVPA